MPERAPASPSTLAEAKASSPGQAVAVMLAFYGHHRDSSPRPPYSFLSKGKAKARCLRMSQATWCWTNTTFEGNGGRPVHPLLSKGTGTIPMPGSLWEVGLLPLPRGGDSQAARGPSSLCPRGGVFAEDVDTHLRPGVRHVNRQEEDKLAGPLVGVPAAGDSGEQECASAPCAMGLPFACSSTSPHPEMGSTAAQKKIGRSHNYEASTRSPSSSVCPSPLCALPYLSALVGEAFPCGHCGLGLNSNCGRGLAGESRAPGHSPHQLMLSPGHSTVLGLETARRHYCESSMTSPSFRQFDGAKYHVQKWPGMH
uniref:uncharacterized protein LOC129508676 n=1 Tax=Nyctereutes procyonoides TaxID=34880 RepID=UPI002444B2E6|nr:uncharacterized protein LOC129508676 [Nyctereutes procyonoides]